MPTHVFKFAGILCCILTSWLGSLAQVGTLNDTRQPLSPNAATLGKFIEIPVGNFTGTPEINIPLYEVKTKDLTVPVSLSYHASGIKVAEVPGWVGAGFMLNAGGAIIRIVRDLPDGIDAPGWHDLTNPSFKGQIDYYQANPSYWPDGRMGRDIVSELYSQKIDMQFDEFYYSFQQYNGVFMFNRQGAAVMKVPNNLRVAYADEHFTITDDRGIIYEFNEYETQSYDPHWYISTWYLTKAYNPINKETVEFVYDSFGMIYPYVTTDEADSYFSQIRQYNSSPNVPIGVPNLQCEDIGPRPGISNELQGNNLFLKQIIYRKDTVNFYPSMTNRSDVYKVQLDSIKVYSSSGIVQRTAFGYTYSDILSTDPMKKKLLLESVKINDQQPYRFNYYGSYLGQTMPGIKSDGADTWGYFNGETSPFQADGKRIMQRYDRTFPLDIFGRNSSYRNPDWKYAQIGSLKSISYPTGGITEFEYEGHEYYDSYIYHTDMLRLDSLRTTGSESKRWLPGYTPNFHTNEFTIHHDQTVSINTTIGLSPDVINLATYRSYLYTQPSLYQSGFVRLFKFNTATGVFDLVESRTFNPVSTIGNPADDAAFYDIMEEGTSTESHTRFLTAGRYKVETEVRNWGVKASLTSSNVFRFVKPGSAYQLGGLRIKKIRFTSPVNNSSYEKTYDYAFDGGRTAGALLIPYACSTTWVHWGEVRNMVINGQMCYDVGAQFCRFLKIHHDNVIPIGNGKGGPIGYFRVIERMNDGRKKVMSFKVIPDEYNSMYNPRFVIADHSCYRGYPLSTTYFDSTNNKIKREVHHYQFEYQPTTVVPSWKLAYVIQNTIVPATPMHNATWTWTTRTIKQQRCVPGVDSVYYFNGADTLKEVTKYSYDSDFYTNPSAITQISSSGDTTITRHKYAYDYSLSGIPTNNFSKGIKLLQDRNILSQPIETYTEIKPAGGGAQVSTAQLVSFQPSIPLADTVYSLSNTNLLNNFSPATFSLSAASKDSRYQRRQLFNKYDNGNLVEQSKDSEVKEVLVWGYQRRFIVARILSSDYNTVIALVDTNVINNPSSDAVMRTELNKIRTALASTHPEAKVSTYTYAGAKGMTSSTDPRGETTHFEYDTFGRLQRTKDAQGDIQDQLWYQYKP